MSKISLTGFYQNQNHDELPDTGSFSIKKTASPKQAKHKFYTSPQPDKPSWFIETLANMAYNG